VQLLARYKTHIQTKKKSCCYSQQHYHLVANDFALPAFSFIMYHHKLSLSKYSDSSDAWRLLAAVLGMGFPLYVLTVSVSAFSA
jgi:hypothetical protein